MKYLIPFSNLEQLTICANLNAHDRLLFRDSIQRNLEKTRAESLPSALFAIRFYDLYRAPELVFTFVLRERGVWVLQ